MRISAGGESSVERQSCSDAVLEDNICEGRGGNAPSVNRGDEWRAPEAGESRHRVAWATGMGVRSQPTGWSGERRELPSGIRGEAPAGNAFWQPESDHFCTYNKL